MNTTPGTAIRRRIDYATHRTLPISDEHGSRTAMRRVLLPGDAPSAPTLRIDPICDGQPFRWKATASLEAAQKALNRHARTAAGLTPEPWIWNAACVCYANAVQLADAIDDVISTVAGGGCPVCRGRGAYDPDIHAGHLFGRNPFFNTDDEPGGMTRLLPSTSEAARVLDTVRSDNTYGGTDIHDATDGAYGGIGSADPYLAARILRSATLILDENDCPLCWGSGLDPANWRAASDTG